jgi:hypothetical protein
VKHGLDFRGDVAIVKGPALRFGVGVIASLLFNVLASTLQPGEDLSVAFEESVARSVPRGVGIKVSAASVTRR